MISYSNRRVEKEFQNYTESYAMNSSKSMIHFKMDNVAFTAKIPSNYPFYPPKLYVNNKVIIYSPNDFPKRLYDKYKENNGCPCCNTITCSENWSPSLGVKNIAREYLSFVHKLKTYQKIKMFEKSKFPDDLIKEIVSYLQ